VSHHKCYIGHSHIIIGSHGSCHMRSHDGCGKVVHRLCSSFISSIENLMETPSSSSCQLRLRVDLSCLG